jgi:dGTP triphosphohydrolase
MLVDHCIPVGKKKKVSTPSKYTSTSSHTNFRYLTTPQKRKRLTSLRAQVTSAERKVNYLMKKIKDSTDVQGVTVDDCLHHDPSQTMEENTPLIIEQFPEGSFKRLFWEQQREACACSVND